MGDDACAPISVSPTSSSSCLAPGPYAASGTSPGSSGAFGAVLVTRAARTARASSAWSTGLLVSTRSTGVSASG